MTNLRTWNDRIRRELRKQWWQTLTVLLALGLGAGLWLAFTGGDESAGATAGCATNGAVPRPVTPGLVADCEALLAMRDTLSGGASLNWSASRPMRNWTGVYQQRGRVSSLLLAGKQLRGMLPAKLGELEGLRTLDLRNNFLTGSIPASLEDVPRLTTLRLAGNRLSGCVPPKLRKVPRNDLAQLNLSNCSGTTTPTATATATPKATPTPTATAQASYTLTLTQAANGRLVVVPAGPYEADSNTIAVVTATPDEGYELTAWGGDCAGTPASASCALDMNADKSATATFARKKPPPAAGPLELMVISKGDADALTLEWTGGPANVTRWQYRTTYWNQAAYRREAWSNWRNVPGTAATRSFRLTRLRSYTGYFFEVRPVVGGTPGTASNTATGATQYADSRAPEIDPGQIVEGDGKTKWRIVSFTFVIPDGMRLRGGSGGVAENRPPVVSVQDVATGSWLVFTKVDGKEWERQIVTPSAGEGQNVPIDPNRDVGKLFDQIVASVRVD